MKIDRQMGILALLLQRGRLSAPELAERFEVSRRTILRDVEELCRAGVPLRTASGKRGGISVMEGYTLERALLAREDLSAILTGLKGLDSVAGDGKYRALMERLSVGTEPAPGSHFWIDLASYYKGSLAQRMSLLSAAMDAHRMITFSYFSPSGESAPEIEPYLLVFQWGAWYAWGYCPAKEGFRLYKLQRMTGLAMTNRPYTPRQLPTPSFSPTAPFPGEHRLRALFRPQMKWRLLEEYGEGSFAETKEGLLMELPYSGDTFILRWLLSFGDSVEVLEPESLRQGLAQLGQALVQKYTRPL
ncbi:MAG: YafY family protein [Eubacteriales bacterium]|nr:YafY family protein [Eubacteriales bacterium]